MSEERHYIRKATWTNADARRWAVYVWAAMQSGWILVHLIGGPEMSRPAMWATGIVSSAVVFFLIRCVRPIPDAAVIFSETEMRVPLGARKTEKRIPWRLISGVYCIGVHDHEWHVVLNLSGFRLVISEMTTHEQALAFKNSVESRLARLPPDVAAKRDTLDAATFFEIVFDIRLPETARTVHTEYHPENGTGWWAVKLPPEALKTLKAGEGTVSAFYPLQPEQRFHVGDRKLAGVSELRGDYAISPHDWNATPVLVVDREESVLHGLLTDAMA